MVKQMKIRSWIFSVLAIVMMAVLLMPSRDVEAAGTVHFEEINGVTYIYDEYNQPVINKWAEIDGKWYFTDAAGKPKKDMIFARGGKRYCLGEDGSAQTGFFWYREVYYYANEECELYDTQTWIQYGKDWYLTDANSRIQMDKLVTINGRMYYLGPAGDMKTGVVITSEGVYYAMANGQIRTTAGWIKSGGYWYYIDKGGKIRTNAGIWWGKTVYYAGADGALTGGVYTVNKNLRFFESDGSAKKNEGWAKYDGVWYYVKSGGIICRNQFVGTGSEMYRVGDDGKLTGGIFKIDGKNYYFNPTTGKIKSTAGWISYNSKWYYADKGGVLRQNQMLWSGQTAYYLGSDCSMQTGLFTIDGVLRYFLPSGEMRKVAGWLKVGTGWYYSDANGAFTKGAKVKSGGKYYYLGTDGKMVTGWVKLSNTVYYYADASGALKCNISFTVNGITYYANSDCEVITNSSTSKAQSYSSNTSYLILVNLSEQKTYVFSGSKGAWNPAKEFTCSTGTSDHPTPTGEYKTTMRTTYFNSFGYRCWWATGFIGGEYLFHSSPYTMTDTPQVCADYTMGRPSSHGCIRMRLDDAKWIYDNIPIGTKVVIYK